MFSWELLWAEIVFARRGSIFFHAVVAAFVTVAVVEAVVVVVVSVAVTVAAVL